MVRRSAELKTERIHHLKGGAGWVDVTEFFEPADFMGKGRLYGQSVIAPGHSIGHHVHEGDQEAYFILEGAARYIDGEVEYTLGPGDFAICRPGQSHAIESLGPEALRYIMLIIYE